MVAAAVRAGQLPIEEERDAGLDGAGTDRIVRDQPGDGRLDEGLLCGREEHIVAARDARRASAAPSCHGTLPRKVCGGPPSSPSWESTTAAVPAAVAPATRRADEEATAVDFRLRHGPASADECLAWQTTCAACRDEQRRRPTSNRLYAPCRRAVRSDGRRHQNALLDLTSIVAAAAAQVLGRLAAAVAAASPAA